MPSIRPTWTELDFGPAGWRTLHELARQRRRSPRDQARQLVLFALDCAIAGQDVELSQERLESLLGDFDFETVVA
jgi:hypothetical protein